MKALASFFAVLLLFPLLALPLRAAPVAAEYTVYFHRIPAATAQGIREGDSVTDGAGKGSAGRVTHVALAPTLTEIYDEARGALQCVQEEGYLDVTVTVRAAAKERGGKLFAGTLPLLCGKTVFLHLPSFCGEGLILSVNAQ